MNGDLVLRRPDGVLPPMAASHNLRLRKPAVPVPGKAIEIVGNPWSSDPDAFIKANKQLLKNSSVADVAVPSQTQDDVVKTSLFGSQATQKGTQSSFNPVKLSGAPAHSTPMAKYPTAVRSVQSSATQKGSTVMTNSGVTTISSKQSLPLLKYGLSHSMSDALRRAGVTSSQITQTIGHAKASNGFHAQEATKLNGEPYSAAVDISVHGMNDQQIKERLERLAQQGYAAYYRKPGSDGWPAKEVVHIHAVYTGVPMKPQLQRQVNDWLNGKNGLASHTPYQYWQPTPQQRQNIRNIYSSRKH